MLSYLINLSYTALHQRFSKHLTAKTLSIPTLAKHKITLARLGNLLYLCLVGQVRMTVRKAQSLDSLYRQKKRMWETLTLLTDAYRGTDIRKRPVRLCYGTASLRSPHGAGAAYME